MMAAACRGLYVVDGQDLHLATERVLETYRLRTVGAESGRPRGPGLRRDFGSPLVDSRSTLRVRNGLLVSCPRDSCT